MTMNLSTRLLAFMVVLVLSGSCHKTAGTCTGNCQVVSFAGIAVDPGAQKPLANLPVTVSMSRVQTCMYCGPYQVAAGKTKADGTFALTVSVDTTKVAFRFCTVTIHGPSNYLVYAVPTGPGVAADPFSSVLSLEMVLDSTGIAPYREFDFFRPAPLTIQLHRTGAIIPSEPGLGLTYIMGASSTSGWDLNESSTNADTALTLLTGADVFTRIETIRYVTDSTKAVDVDSIRCVAGGSNTIKIVYP